MRNRRIIGLLWALSVLSAPFVACAQGIVKKNEGIAKSESSKKGIISSCSEKFRSLSPQTKAGLAIAGAIPAYYAARRLTGYSSDALYKILKKDPKVVKLIMKLFFDTGLVGGSMMAAYVAAMIPFLQQEPLPKP